MYLLVRNKVEDYDIWHEVFKEDEARGADYGLKQKKVWTVDGEPNHVFFILEVQSRERAEAFMALPKSAKMGEKARVIEGEYWFLEGQ